MSHTLGVLPILIVSFTLMHIGYHGVCNFDSELGDYTCVCEAGYSGQYCDQGESNRRVETMKIKISIEVCLVPLNFI